jgi:hypothetical protein
MADSETAVTSTFAPYDQYEVGVRDHQQGGLSQRNSHMPCTNGSC